MGEKQCTPQLAMHLSRGSVKVKSGEECCIQKLASPYEVEQKAQETIQAMNYLSPSCLLPLPLYFNDDEHITTLSSTTGHTSRLCSLSAWDNA